MAIQFKDGKILFVSNQIAMDPACCCCPCDETTDLEHGSTCCLESVSFALSLTDEWRWYLVTFDELGQTIYRRLITTGWSAADATYTWNRVGGSGTDKCDWTGPSLSGVSISWIIEDSEPISVGGCPDASTTWTQTDSGTSSAFFSGVAPEDQVLFIYADVNGRAFGAKFLPSDSTSGTGSHCEQNTLNGFHDPDDGSCIGSIDWDAQQVSGDGECTLCTAANDLGSVLATPFEYA